MLFQLSKGSEKMDFDANDDGVLLCPECGTELETFPSEVDFDVHQCPACGWHDL